MQVKPNLRRKRSKVLRVPFFLVSRKKVRRGVVKNPMISRSWAQKAVISSATTPLIALNSPQLPIYSRPFLGVRIPFITIVGAHLEDTTNVTNLTMDGIKSEPNNKYVRGPKVDSLYLEVTK